MNLIKWTVIAAGTVATAITALVAVAVAIATDDPHERMMKLEEDKARLLDEFYNGQTTWADYCLRRLAIEDELATQHERLSYEYSKIQP